MSKDVSLGLRTHPSHHAITIGRPPPEVGAAFDEIARERNFAPLTVHVAEAPMNRGTELHVDVVEGGVAHVIRAMRGETRDQQAREVLRDLKSQLECGEALRVMPQPDARGWLSRAWQLVITDRMHSGGRR